MLFRSQTAVDISEMGLDTAYFARLGDTIRNRAGAIYSWLMSVDVSAFDPKGRAPVTLGTVEMIEATTDEAYERILQMLESGGISGANDRAFINQAVASAANNVKVSAVRDIAQEYRWKAYLKEKGWVKFPKPYYLLGEMRRGWFKKALVPDGKRDPKGIAEILLSSDTGNGVPASVTDIMSARRKI